MKAEKVWAVLELYDREIGKLFEPKQMIPEQYDMHVLRPEVFLGHCRWMAQECLTRFKPEYEAAWAEVVALGRMAQHPEVMVNAVVEARKPLEKAMRWMCYIQGVLNAFGMYSCNQLRDQSRGDEGAFKTAAEEHAPVSNLFRSLFPPKEIWATDFANAPELKAPPACQSMEPEHPALKDAREAEAAHARAVNVYTKAQHDELDLPYEPEEPDDPDDGPVDQPR